ncbi:MULTISPECIES: LytR C-terminal domain-containing protein [Corynebacterium]|uniref:LytR C-terminal domain-containing protein n=1 Tax=Corynebacterium lipophilum TaxID=2804918 RepID=A0AAW5HVN5_9CORY|nr:MULTISPECIES: LytR C-terminal domain-containing protein [Corynebacterium]MCO6394498.1 LytR C-terminal domain-containing protein [Corynebacterium lipophilum]MCZ2117943.1 LytR C-terminal domain-containing protein [Corynebacterium lipophilum]
MTNVNPENEYQGAHRRAEEDDYDQNYEAAPAAAFPKRGVAMILLAVAALLLLWGIYAMNKGDGNQDAAAPGSTEATTAQATQATQATTAISAPANSSEQAQPSEQEKPAEEAKPTEKPAEQEQPAPAPAGLAREQAQVYVYNNSGIPDLANRTAGDLAAHYNVANRSNDAAAMNMPEQTYGAFPQTFVFFNPNTPGADAVAAELAQRIGGTPRATTDVPANTSLPREAVEKPEAITVVLAGE